MPADLIPAGIPAGTQQQMERALDAQRQPTPMEMIAAIARDPSIPIDRISALIGLQERMEAREAEKSYNVDFAAAMMDMPRVAKRGAKKMGDKGTIMYATYEDVDAAIRPVETRHGFARSFSTRSAENKSIMTLRLTHRAGHSTISERVCRADPGPGRNDIQAEGSGESYSRRYLTLAVWNIVTVGADDDGNSADPINQEQCMKLQEMLDGLNLTPPQMELFCQKAEAGTISGIQQRKYADVHQRLMDTYRQRGGGK